MSAQGSNKEVGYNVLLKNIMQYSQVTDSSPASKREGLHLVFELKTPNLILFSGQCYAAEIQQDRTYIELRNSVTSLHEWGVFHHLFRTDSDLEGFLKHLVDNAKHIKSSLGAKFIALEINSGVIPTEQPRDFCLQQVLRALQNPKLTDVLPIKELSMAYFVTSGSLELSLDYPSSLSHLVAASRSLQKLTVKLCKGSTTPAHINCEGLAAALNDHPSLKSFEYATFFESVSSVDGLPTLRRNECSMDLVARTLAQAPNLKSIKLGNQGVEAFECPLTAGGLRELLELAPRDRRFELALESCCFSELHAEQFSRGFKTSAIYSLKFEDCSFLDRIFPRIVSGLSIAPNLRRLCLNIEAFQFTIPDALALMDFVKGTRTLEELRYWRYPVSGRVDWGIYALVSGILENEFNSIKILGLRYPKMHDGGYEMFEYALQDHIHKKRAKQCPDAIEQSLRPSSADAENPSVGSLLLAYLSQAHHLKSLDLSNCGKIDRDLLVNALEKNKGLEYLDIRYLQTMQEDDTDDNINGIVTRHMEICLKAAARCVNLKKLPKMDLNKTGERLHWRVSKHLRELEHKLDSLLRFRQDGRDEIIQIGATSKKRAVEILIENRDELLCLYEALHLNPNLFFP